MVREETGTRIPEPETMQPLVERVTLLVSPWFLGLGVALLEKSVAVSSTEGGARGEALPETAEDSAVTVESTTRTTAVVEVVVPGVTRETVAQVAELGQELAVLVALQVVVERGLLH